jgi:endonuclease YncB( thermonuclease family)
MDGSVDGRGWFAAAGLIGLLLAVFAAALPGSAAARDRDCSDFSTQGQAQAYFESRGGGPNNNVDRLDADGDGRACESLPCPCAGPGGGGGGTGQAQHIRARITKNVDGDTVDVRAFGTRRRFYSVRLIGIDTPEKYGQRECGAGRASHSMERLAPVGARVTLVTDPTQPRFDRYNRLLAYVMRLGRDLNRAQLSGGWARVYIVGNRFRRLRSYRRAQRVARSDPRGVWKLCGGRFRAR